MVDSWYNAANERIRERKTMKLPKSEIKITVSRGKGPGGQHKNKTSSRVRAVHIPTGIEVVIDGRHQGRNKKVAIRELVTRVLALREEIRAAAKKECRNKKIRAMKTVRTYNLHRGVVKDHRTGKEYKAGDVLKKDGLQQIILDGQMDRGICDESAL
jgi:peptide chain release factor 2